MPEGAKGERREWNVRRNIGKKTRQVGISPDTADKVNCPVLAWLGVWRYCERLQRQYLCFRSRYP